MMTQKKALKILRIKTDNGEDTDRAYDKLIHRYPATLFPEKFREIREAYSFLKDKDDYWRDLLESDHPDLEALWEEWTENPLPSLKPANPELTLETEQEFLSRTLPPFLRHTLFD